MGILKLEQAVPAEVLKTARDLVEAWTAAELEPERITEYTNRTFAPDLGTDPRLIAPFAESRLKSDCESLIAPQGFDEVRSVQIALRVPRELTGGIEQPVKPMHVDGVYCTFLPPGSVQTFTLNVGILLDDVPDPRGGALHYVPAGHKRMAQWLRDGGVPTAEAEAPDDIATLPGRPLCGKAGDAVIMHHLLPHRVGANDTGHMRSMLYFRVKHVEHERLKLDALIDPWLEFPGVRRPHETSSAR